MMRQADSLSVRSLWGCACVVGLFSLFWVSAAQASRLATVDLDNVEVYESPKKGSKVIGTLKKDTHVLASNYPTENFHKIKTKEDLKGWVLADTLVLKDIPSGAPERTLAGDEKPVHEEPQPEHVKRKKGESTPSFKFRVLGGLNFYNAAGIVANFDNLKMGYGFGGELHFILSRFLSLGIRGELMSSSATLTDASTGKVFSVTLGSIPLMIGLEATLVDEDKLSIHLAALGGYGAATQVTSTIIADGSAAGVSTGTLTGLGKLDVHLKFTRAFSIFIEGGYRFLQTSSLTAPSGTAASILNAGFNINLTGPFLGAGLSLSF